MSYSMLDAIKKRRVARSMTDQRIEPAQLERVLEAGRWAPSAGNHRPHRFVAVQDPLTIRLIRMVSPGMFPHPTALVLICNDEETTAFHRIPTHNTTLYMDVGTAAQNMLLAAHAEGLASGPVTSFSKEAVRVVLNLPGHLSPQMFICLGHAGPPGRSPMRPSKKVTWRDLTYWERFPSQG